MWYFFQVAVAVGVFIASKTSGLENNYAAALLSVMAVVAAQIFIGAFIGLADGARMLLASARDILARRGGRAGQHGEANRDVEGSRAIGRHPSDSAKLVDGRRVGQDVR